MSLVKALLLMVAISAIIARPGHAFQFRPLGVMESRTSGIDASLRETAALRTQRSYIKPEVLDGFKGSMSVAELLKSEDVEEGALAWSSYLFRVPLFAFFYQSFPVLNQLVGCLRCDNSALLSALTGGFLPAISVLFGSLAGMTISTALSNQKELKEKVNMETSCMLILAKHLSLALNGRDDKSRAMALLWKHTSLLMSCSRAEEMDCMLSSCDPLLSLMDLLDRREEQGEGVAAARAALKRVTELRQHRLTAEGEAVPFVQFNVLLCLGFTMIFSFLALCSNSSVEMDANSVWDAQLTFSMLTSSMALCFNFLCDLNSPFAGKLLVGRQLLTSVNFLQIKQQVVAATADEPQWLESVQKTFENQLGSIQTGRKSEGQQLIQRQVFNWKFTSPLATSGAAAALAAVNNLQGWNDVASNLLSS